METAEFYEDLPVHEQDDSSNQIDQLQTQFKFYIDKSPYAIFIANNEAKYVYVNSNACTLLGYTEKELLQKTIRDITPPGVTLAKFYELKESGGELENYETSLLRKDGTTVEVDLKATYLGNNLYMAYVHEITERKNFEERILKMNQKMHMILDSFTDGFYSMDRNLCFTYVNNKTVKLFGIAEEKLIGMNLKDVIPRAYWKRVRYFFTNALRTGKPVIFEVAGAGGRWIETNINIIEDGLSVFFRDITERKTLQEELSRLDRLNLVGQMASGLGHEIRNPMTSVRGFLQLLANKERDNKKLEYYDIMIGELDRANSIIVEFLSLAKDRLVELKPASLNMIIESLYPLLDSDAMLRDTRIVLDKGEIPDIPLSEKEIRQLIINLVRNAIEASPPMGVITISTYADNSEVVLSVEDKGTGISPEILHKIGTPFVTTKSDGTGLGISVCYSIAYKHNAKIDLKTGSTGTTFYVKFKIPS